MEDEEPRTDNKSVRWFQNIVNRIKRERKVNQLQHDQVGYYLKDVQEETEQKEKPEYKIEVSNLMPEYQCQIQVEIASRRFEALRDVLMNVLKGKGRNNEHDWRSTKKPEFSYESGWRTKTGWSNRKVSMALREDVQAEK